MDRFNNALGRTLAVQHPYYTEFQFKDAARAMALADPPATKNAKYAC